MRSVQLALAIAVCLAPSCARKKSQSPAPDGKLRVVATVGMVADVVRQVGQDHVVVTQIMGSGVDPHLYKATRDDVSTIMNAEIVFYSGLMLEGKMADVLRKVAHTKSVYAVAESIDPDALLETSPGTYDPHVWMDPMAWSRCVDVVCEALSQQRPEEAGRFAENAESYKVKLLALHEYGKQTIERIPKERRVLITSHDAFGYFGRAYDIKVLGVQGLSTESEAGLQRINELVDLIVERNVRSVFVESSVSRKSIDALLAGAKSKGASVTVGGELFSDAMGPPGTYEGTYVGMLDHNITVVASALGASPPTGGMQGMLALGSASVGSRQ